MIYRKLYHNIAALISAIILFYACGGEPDVPLVVKPSQPDPVSIAFLKSMYGRSPVIIGGDITVRGHVISSDQTGNCYKALFIEDVSGGIAIRIDLENYHRKYYHGAYVEVKCNSLVLNSYGGMIQLNANVVGDGNPGSGYIPEDRLDAVISIDRSRTEEPLPVLLTVPEIDDKHISRLVRVTGVQFVDSEISKAWCEPGTDTDRHLTDRDGNLLKVRTSCHSVFANWLLPHQSGFVQGILQYFNGNYQLVVCSYAAVGLREARF